MPVTKKTPVKTLYAFDVGTNQSLFYRAWRIMHLDGPLCPLPAPTLTPMSAELERMRRQQAHVDEIKRLCHVPVTE